MEQSAFLKNFSIKEEDQLSKINETRNNLKKFTVAKETLTAYSKTVDDLFLFVLELVRKYNSFKSQENLYFIDKLIPLPTKDMLNSTGKKLGYVQSIIQFFSYAANHFLILTIKGQRTKRLLDQQIKELATTDMTFKIAGQLESIDLSKMIDDNN